MSSDVINNLTILQLNDLHGYLEPHWEMVHETNEWSFKKLDIDSIMALQNLFKHKDKITPSQVQTVFEI